ncbi:hypothetical protein LTR37_009868 [Vermiconidia calcicola]|uniref:Uncharacterized protein n=1 Tax=Vermiconidia calcicola TaxID=1690605 RepID=A0ACC3N825_9PEZI|nr:hypothetical protein LTR37_009868 [Vermiconidia calcicola]
MHAYMQQPETGAWNVYQQAILPWKTIVTVNGWTRKNLQRYGRFGALYGKRKYATKYPSSPFRLLDLPAEIRNKIYRYHLIIGSIELAPRVAPGGQLSDFRKHRRQCLHEEGHGAWKFNIMRTLARRDGGVKDYKLVLPDQFILLQKRNFVDYHTGRSPLPWFKKDREVNMTLVKAQTEQGFDNTGDRQEQLALRQAVEQEVRASGWKVVDTTYDTLGNYEVDDHSDAEEDEDAGDVDDVAQS